jgi:MFS family permease
MNVYLSLIRRRPQYRFLWFAQVVSLLGDWFNVIATVTIVARYTDSVQSVSLLFLARGLPPFLFGPLAGVVADRFNRKTILIVSDVLRFFIVLGLLLVTSADRLWLVYVLTMLQFMVSAFFEPARAAILPSLVEGDELLTANTLSSATWSAVLAFGAAIGAFTADAFGVRAALALMRRHF